MGITVVLETGFLEGAPDWVTRIQALLPDETVLRPNELGGVSATDVDVVVCGGNAQGFAEFPNLRFAQSLWAGIDGLLRDPHLPADLTIARMVAPSLTTSMNEFVAMAVLYLHRLVPNYQAQQRAGAWVEHHQPMAHECPVAILGAGALGSASAAVLRELGFPVRLWGRSLRADDPTVLVGADGLRELLGSSAVVVNLLPLTPDTTDIVNASFVEQCKPGLGFINVGRGRHVVDDALLAGLDSGVIGHAVLDVFREEPLPKAHRYWTHPGVTLFPHVAAASTADSVAQMAAEGIRAYRAGLPVPNLVDRVRGY